MEHKRIFNSFREEDDFVEKVDSNENTPVHDSVDVDMDSVMERIVNDSLGDYELMNKSHGINYFENTSDKSTVAKSNRKFYKYRKQIIIFLVALAAAICLWYVLVSLKYHKVFLDKTFINGLNVSGMTVDEVESQIRESIESYELTIIFKDGSTETLTSKEMDYQYISDNGSQKILDEQKSFTWLLRGLLEEDHYFVGEDTTYSLDKIQETITSLPEVSGDNIKDPQDAFLKLKHNGVMIIVKESQGNRLNTDVLINLIEQSVRRGDKVLDLRTEPDAYLSPKITQDNENLIRQRDELNAFLDTKITYDLLYGKTKVLDRKTTSKWLVVSEDKKNYSIDENLLYDKAGAFAYDLAMENDEARSSFDFQTTLRGSITKSCPEYVNTIDQSAEANHIVQDLMAHTSVEREPEYSRKDGEVDSQYGGNYVEVDLQNQKVFLYKNHELIMETDTVTGTGADPKYATPTGVYNIFHMSRDTILYGPEQEDGSFEYESYVDYWMPFNGNIGFHDAQWRTEFGGDIYMFSGSHGCINLPLDKAAFLYSQVSLGYTVIVI